MKKAHQTVPENRENVKMSVKCPCPGNPNYIRKTDRPALASIQGEAANRQCLIVNNCGQKIGRSRSLSACYPQSTSLKPSPGPKQALLAETSRKTQYPSVIQLAHFLPPATVTIRPKTIANKSRGQPLVVPRKACRNSSCSSTDSAFRVYESAQSDSGYDDFLHPKSNTNHSATRSTTQSRSALNGTQLSSISDHHKYFYDCQSAIQKSRSIENLSTATTALAHNILISKRSSSSSRQQTNSLSDHHQQHPHVTFSRYAQVSTLPDQIFYTLMQDTVGTTQCSTVDTSDSFISKTENVRLIRDSSVLSEGDKTFVDGKQFFSDIDHGKCSTTKSRPVVSPCSLSVPLRRSNSVSGTSTNEHSRMPAVKSTLKKRNTKKLIMFPLLYSPEYREDVIGYCYNHRSSFVIRSDLIRKFVDKRARTNIVDWLIGIHGFIAPHFEPIQYMSIRLFDYAIIRLGIRKSHYQLAAIASYWIALKYLDTTILLKVSKIYSLCNGKYSKEQILSMERKILKSINFCLNVPDPLDFLHNYLKVSNLENDEVLKNAAKFALECSTLFETYPMTNPPFVAASALYLAYTLVKKSDEECVNLVGNDRENIQYYVEKITKHNVKYVIMEKYRPLIKYLAAEKLSVANMFFDLV